MLLNATCERAVAADGFEENDDEGEWDELPEDDEQDLGGDWEDEEPKDDEDERPFPR